MLKSVRQGRLSRQVQLGCPWHRQQGSESVERYGHRSVCTTTECSLQGPCVGLPGVSNNCSGSCALTDSSCLMESFHSLRICAIQNRAVTTL
eukprot:1365735-Rhodomonas_salina.2